METLTSHWMKRKSAPHIDMAAAEKQSVYAEIVYDPHQTLLRFSAPSAYFLVPVIIGGALRTSEEVAIQSSCCLNFHCYTKTLCN
jgi:hypothetical protein